MCGTVPLIAALLLAADLKPETPPAPVKEALDRYLKAVAAQDLDAMVALADVPWLDRGRQFVRDKAGLRKALEGVAGQLPKDEGERKVEAFRYKNLRPRIKDEVERKVLDELLGDDGWYAAVEEDGYPLSVRVLLLRVKDGKAAVVGGPLKPNQITPTNRIPAAADLLLDKAETFELYSLDPELVFDKDGKLVVPAGAFHEWKVLGKTEVKGATDRKRLADALRLGAEDNHGMVAKCFIPRHGVRLKGGGKSVDLVICFQCLSAQVYVDGKPTDGFLTTGDPQPAFDAVLKAAGIKLPKQAKD